MREWLPKVAGIERSPELRIGEGGAAARVRGALVEEHADLLTREQVTGAVHYMHFDLGESMVERFRREPVTMAVTHPAYSHESRLSQQVKDSLLKDLEAQS